MAARHNISFADALYRGRAVNGAYQFGKPGTSWMPLYRWKPTGSRAIAFTAALTAGLTAAVLTASWGPPTDLYTITFSDGSTLNGLFTNGSTAVSFYPATVPARPTSAYPNYGNLTGCNAVSANATVAGTPPVVSVANAFALSQAVAAAGAALLNGAYVGTLNSTVLNISTVTQAGIPDVPRNVVAAWTGAAILTITGFDYIGNPQTEVSASGTSWTGKKSFSSVTSLVFSAAVTAATVGFGNALGFPFLVKQGELIAPQFGYVADAGTVVPWDITSPATAATGDVRGTYLPAATLTGNTFLSALIHVSDPQTQYGAFGCTPA